MRHVAIFLVFLITGFLCSCQDNEELKIPAEVGFSMDINRGTSSNGRLQFTEGNITLSSFSFDGKREQGSDVTLSREYEPGLAISFDPIKNIEALNFTILQGNYTSIEIEFETFDSFDQNGLLVTGWYLNSNGIRYPIRVELGASINFEIEAKEQSGNTQIIIRQDKPAVATIKLHPLKWFEAVPSSFMDNATLTSEEDTSVILINEDINESIYALIVDRIEQSAEVVFK